MKKRILFYIGILVVILAIISCFLIIYFNKKDSQSHIIFQNKGKLSIEVADDDSERQKGLMYRESLDYNSGMLFIFPDEKARSFWMRNTLIYLDMIFIDSSGKIVDIIENAEPCKEDPCRTYDSKYPAKYVLETNAGYAKEKNIAIGELISFSI
jgi:uncharacterized membrane protein (UPF0127 family)